MKEIKTNNLTKEKIAYQINQKTGLPNSLAKRIIDDLLNTINELIRDEKGKFSNFGTFKLLKKKERLGRNPKTNENFVIKARNSISFIPSNFIKKKINPGD